MKRILTTLSQKWPEYLLEILVITVGILGAYTLNNWNENTKTKQLEIKYLKEMHTNLKFDLQDIDFNIDFNESRYASNKIVLEHLRKKQPYHDSLDFHLSNLLYSTRTLPNTSAYESLTSRGLEIISNDSLRAHITNVYSVHFHNVIDFEHADDHPHQYQVMWQPVMNAIEVDSLGGSAKPINYDAMMNDIKFKNALASNVTIRRYMLDTYKGLRSHITRLIAHIESEVDVLEE